MKQDKKAQAAFNAIKDNNSYVKNLSKVISDMGYKLTSQIGEKEFIFVKDEDHLVSLQAKPDRYDSKKTRWNFWFKKFVESEIGFEKVSDKKAFTQFKILQSLK